MDMSTYLGADREKAHAQTQVTTQVFAHMTPLPLGILFLLLLKGFCHCALICVRTMHFFCK